MTKHNYYTILVLSLLISCSPEKDRSSRFGSPNYSNINKENVSRDVWQKPGKVLDALGDIENKTIADIGAGTGYFTFRMALNAKKVIAIDIDPDMINLVEAFKLNLPQNLSSKIETRLATPADPGLKPNDADIVVIINTASYIEDKFSYFKNIFFNLPPDGKLMIVDYKQSKLPISLEQGNFKISGTELKSLLSAAGFKDTALDDSSLEYQYIVIAQKGE